MSEYCRLKFGPKGAYGRLVQSLNTDTLLGSPVAYEPMSIQQPDQVLQMQARQAINARQRTWWTSDEHRRSTPKTNSTPGPQKTTSVNHLSLGSNNIGGLPQPPLLTPSNSDLQQELTAAMSSDLPRCPSIISIPQFQAPKTSETHPIKYVAFNSI